MSRGRVQTDGSVSIILQFFLNSETIFALCLSVCFFTSALARIRVLNFERENIVGNCGQLSLQGFRLNTEIIIMFQI